MEAVILIGIQGSGKTTFYQRRFSDTHVRLSLDMLRTRHRESLLVQACIAAQQPFVVDNTDVRKAERERFITPAKQARFRVIGYYFKPELRASIGRNNQRAGKKKIPAPGVIGTWKRLEPPSPEEGFDQLWIVEIDEKNEFLVSPWAPDYSD